jgi:DNA-binding response OmpR family regulator
MTTYAPRVLVVEDEFLIAEDVADALRRAGAEVIGPALTFDESMALLDANAIIDAAVLDLNLRGQSALPIAELCSNRSIPFVFTTGYDGADLTAHVDAPRFQKPTEPAIIARAVMAMLKR